MSTADPQAVGAHGGAGDPAAGGVDPAAFTPEQWQAYQHAYSQAMQAQQMYAQAQQAYAQAEQSGQADVAQHAYAQATQAQQLYTQAHQAYLAILQQVQGQAGMQDPNQQAAMQAQQQAAMQAQQQAAYEQQQAYAQQQAMQQQQMQQQQMQQQAMQQQQMQQQAYEQQAAMQAQQQAMYAQQQGYYDPNQQAAMQAQQQAAMQAQQQAMHQQSGMYQQATHYDPQQAYHAQQIYAQSQQAMPQAPTGDPLATADWDEAYYDDGGLEAQGGGGGAIWFWIIGMGAIIGSIIALHFATQPPPPLDDPYGEKKKEKISPEERERRRRILLGLDKEQPTKYIRPLSLSMKKRAWGSVAVAGRGECRTMYYSDATGVYAAEANAPKEEKDYIKKIHPDYPFALRKLPLPMRTLSRQLLTGPGGTYLLLRAQIARQSWMLVYPLIGNPLKGKGSKRGAACGESGRTPDSFLDKRNLVLLGEGSCSLANDTLGVKPRLCLSGITVPTRAPLWFWQQGRRLSPPKGYLLLGTNVIKIKRKAKARTSADIYGTLQRSSMPSFDRKKMRWVAVERGSRSVWSFDPRGPRPTGIEIPLLTKTALRILITKKFIRVVYPTRVIKFAREGRTSLRRVAIYPFGKNVVATHASWDRDGHILLLVTKKKTVYQFSENP